MAIEVGWAQVYLDALTVAALNSLGITEAVICASGTDHRPTELWASTNLGIAKMTATDSWSAIDIELTPWRHVKWSKLTARASEYEPDAVATLELSEPSLRLEVVKRSSVGAATRQRQWPFVADVLKRLNG